MKRVLPFLALTWQGIIASRSGQTLCVVAGMACPAMRRNNAGTYWASGSSLQHRPACMTCAAAYCLSWYGNTVMENASAPGKLHFEVNCY